MNKIKAKIIIKGEVQKVGYRDEVKKIASDFGAKGYVENLRNSDVQVICEIDDKLLEAFVKALKVKKDFINVEYVEVVETSAATGEFEYFDIKYGRLEEELGDRAGAMILYLGGIQSSVNKVGDEVKQVGEKVECVGEKVERVGEKVDRVGEKVECVGEKVERVGEKVGRVGEKVDRVGEKVECVGENVDSMHGDMNERFDKLDNTITEKFDRLDDKYHGMTDILKSINENQTNMQKEFVESRQELTKVVDKLVVIVDRFIEDEKNKESG